VNSSEMSYDLKTYLRMALSSSLLKFSGLGALADRGPRVFPDVSIWLITEGRRSALCQYPSFTCHLERKAGSSLAYSRTIFRFARSRTSSSTVSLLSILYGWRIVRQLKQKRT
jgi:hypothetical protein